MDKIELAKSIAYAYHGNQLYGDDLYFNHLMRVYTSVYNAGYDEDYQIVALLHDSIEDTCLSYETLEKNFGERVTSAIASITHIKKENYFDYIRDAVMMNKISKVVKFFDLLDNLEHSFKDERYKSLIPRYKRALQIMTIGEIKNE